MKIQVINRPLLATALAVLLPHLVGAQAPAVQFQTETTFVDVDVIVTDEKGTFIGDLARGDFEIWEDGKAQKLDTFSFVSIPVQRQDRFVFRDRPITPDVRSNRQPFAGRLYVIVLDDLDVSPMRTLHVRKFAREFIEKRLGANDLAAVAYTSGRDSGQDFTGDQQLLLAAVDRFVGRKLLPENMDMLDQAFQRAVTGSTMTEEDLTNMRQLGDKLNNPATTAADQEKGHRAVTVLSTLKNVSDFLASIRGRRKAVLLFSEGIDYPMTDVFGVGTSTDVLRMTEDAITAATKANVNFFTLDPRGLIGMSPEFMEMTDRRALDPSAPAEPTPLDARKDLMAQMRISLDSLRALAEQTGGIPAINSNDLESTYDRIVERNSRYYVLGYYPPTHPRDGRFHRIEVRVKRPGVNVMARKGYASPRGKTPEERAREEEARRVRDARKPLADNTTPQLREVLGTPLQQSGLTLSVQAAAFRHTKKDASVALAIEIDGDRLPFAQQPNGTYGNQLELSYFNLDENGKAHQGIRGIFDVTLRAENLGRVKSGGVRANTRIVLPPGRHQIRVGVREREGGASGSVFYDLQVPDFSGQSLMMSGLLLTATSAKQTFTAQPDAVVAKLLPAPATSRREFQQEDTLALLAEIYDNAPKERRTIDTAVRLLDDSGRELSAARDPVVNDTGWEVFSLTRQIPLKGIPPGRYLLRVESQARGNAKDAPVAAESVITIR
ncbi:MAG: VWA domain-containing protein [Vicinamibacterales bacterium]|nr:VWA domain-containing protein [Vicinamibacterales bacterium]